MDYHHILRNALQKTLAKAAIDDYDDYDGYDDEDPTGACCIGTICSIRTEEDCGNRHGSYRGDDTSCSGDTCEPCESRQCTDCIEDCLDSIGDNDGDSDGGNSYEQNMEQCVGQVLRETSPVHNMVKLCEQSKQLCECQKENQAKRCVNAQICCQESGGHHENCASKCRNCEEACSGGCDGECKNCVVLKGDGPDLCALSEEVCGNDCDSLEDYLKKLDEHYATKWLADFGSCVRAGASSGDPEGESCLCTHDQLFNVWWWEHRKCWLRNDAGCLGKGNNTNDIRVTTPETMDCFQENNKIMRTTCTGGGSLSGRGNPWDICTLPGNFGSEIFARNIRYGLSICKHCYDTREGGPPNSNVVLPQVRPTGAPDWMWRPCPGGSCSRDRMVGNHGDL